MRPNEGGLERLKRLVDRLPADPELALEQLVETHFYKQLATLPMIEQSLVLYRLQKRTRIAVSEARRWMHERRLAQADATHLRDLVLAAWSGRVHVRYVAAWHAWFVYEGGVYRRTLEQVMLKRTATILEGAGNTPSERTLNDVLAKVARADGIFAEPPSASLPLLNVRNGLLNVDTLELTPHTPDIMTLAQAPTVFDPAASAPRFEAFLTQAVPDRTCRLTLQEFMGYVLTPHTFLQRALYLKGPGGTGKSTLLAVMQRLLADGDDGLSCNLPIEELRDGSPALGNAVGKRLIYISEVPARTSLIGFKKIVGEDRVVINPKYKPPFDIQLEAKIVITANDFIHAGSDNNNNSIDRRLILLPFGVRPAPHEINPRLVAQLITPEELSGVLLWALEGWARLRANGFRFSSYGDATQRLEFLANSNPVIAFVQERCCAVERGEIRTSELFDAWRCWCEGEPVAVLADRSCSNAPAGSFQQRRGGSGYRVGSIIAFSKRLDEAIRVLAWPVSKVRKEKGSTWLGLALDQPTVAKG